MHIWGNPLAKLSGESGGPEAGGGTVPVLVAGRGEVLGRMPFPLSPPMLQQRPLLPGTGEAPWLCPRYPTRGQLHKKKKKGQCRAGAVPQCQVALCQRVALLQLTRTDRAEGAGRRKALVPVQRRPGSQLSRRTPGSEMASRRLPGPQPCDDRCHHPGEKARKPICWGGGCPPSGSAILIEIIVCDIL